MRSTPPAGRLRSTATQRADAAMGGWPARRWLGLVIEPEHEPPTERIGFAQPHLQRVAEPEAAPRMPPAQPQPCRVEAVEVARQAGDRDQPVGAALRDDHKQPEAGDPADPGGEGLADPAAQQPRAVAV